MTEELEQHKFEDLKLVLIGDPCVGKTSLFMTFYYDKFPPDPEFAPSVFDNQEYFTLSDKSFRFTISDSAGQEDYDRLRQLLVYPNTSLALICYSVDDPLSLEHVKTKWLPEVSQYCPNVPIILVACKIDLRETTTGGNIIPKEEGLGVAQDLGFEYFETSSLKYEGVKDCFEFAVKVYRVHRDGKCTCKVPKCKLPHGRKLKKDEINLRKTTIGGNIIPKEEGFGVAQDLGFEYFETSSLRYEGVKDCFEFAVKVYRVHRDGKCICKVPKCKLPHGRKLKKDELKKFKCPEEIAEKKTCTVV